MAWPEPSQPGVGHLSSWDRPGSGRPHPELNGKLKIQCSVQIYHFNFFLLIFKHVHCYMEKFTVYTKLFTDFVATLSRGLAFYIYSLYKLIFQLCELKSNCTILWYSGHPGDGIVAQSRTKIKFDCSTADRRGQGKFSLVNNKKKHKA